VFCFAFWTAVYLAFFCVCGRFRRADLGRGGKKKSSLIFDNFLSEKRVRESADFRRILPPQKFNKNNDTNG